MSFCFIRHCSYLLPFVTREKILNQPQPQDFTKTFTLNNLNTISKEWENIPNP